MFILTGLSFLSLCLHQSGNTWSANDYVNVVNLLKHMLRKELNIFGEHQLEISKHDG